MQYSTLSSIILSAVLYLLSRAVPSLQLNILEKIYTTAGAGIACQYSIWLGAGQLRGWSLSPGGVKNFLFSTSSRLALGSTQPPIQWVLGALSPEVKWLGCEADHSPPPSVEAKKIWMYTSTPPYAFMA
jgi:hypothetical protein